MFLMQAKHVHLVGIGGAGMAGLAVFMLDAGKIVSGSDLSQGITLDTLAAAGARLWTSHDEAHLEGVDLVVVSDAIPTGNVELEGACRRGIRVLRRAECLDLLGQERCAVMVAGSHGKSTTSGMITSILDAAGRDPGFVLGADVHCLGDQRARAGAGAHFVAEACEAFRNLDVLNPSVAIITNVDDEHVNHYATQAKLDDSFSSFAKRARTIVASGEDAGVARLDLPKDRVIRFGLTAACQVHAAPSPAPFVPHIDGQPLGVVRLHQPGDHMRRNALAALATCHALGIETDAIIRGLERFTGVARRWHELGEVAGIRIVDDYAHHPTEIRATLAAARLEAPDRRLVVAFQPLLHSRVQRLLGDFVESLALADQVLLLEVDGNGEGAESMGSAGIADGLRQRGVPVALREDAEALIADIRHDLRLADMLIVMGCSGMVGIAAQIGQELDQQPQTAISPAPLIRAISPQRLGWSQRLMASWRRETTFVEMFRLGARSHPDATALVGRDGVWSYAALNQASDEVAAGLSAEGLGGKAIGVALPLGADLIVAMLGVMKAGGSYVPLDLALPEDRQRYMRAQAGVVAIIGRSPARDVAVFSTTALRLSGHIVPPAPLASDAAYICFTSGSTGYPKGLRIAHGALAALLRDTTRRFATGAGCRMLLNTAIGFDVSLAEICGTLAGGGSLAVASARPLGGRRLSDAIERLEVSHLSITPSLLSSAPYRALPSLRCIIAAGEACPAHLVAEWGAGRQFFNAYGPTEATVYATAALCDGKDTIPIGTALAHVEAHVLDDALRPVATGELGELCLSGTGVADGYLGNPEETASRFVQVQIGWRKLRVYRTGDMVRRDRKGVLHFVGRADSQIKINGMRIELGEIERAVLRDPLVAAAAVCLTRDRRPTLLCFVQAVQGKILDLAGLSTDLARWLPEGAVPSRIQLVGDIPLTPSGKIDRQKLLTTYGKRIITRAPEHWPAASETEARLMLLWQEALGLSDPVGRLDNFAALGGDSLASLILVHLIEEQFTVTVPPSYFGRIGALSQMATQLEELMWHHTELASEATGFMAGRIYRRMHDLCAQWPGTRLTEDHLTCSLGASDAQHNIFLCCQMESEFAALAAHLPATIRLHGMRSGHLVIDNTAGDIHLLASRYAEEISQIHPEGPIILAGVCQGGAIARTAAQILLAQGREVPLLVLIEAGQPRPYPGPVALIWAEESFLNPLIQGRIGLVPYEDAMPAGISCDIVPGSHGAACVEPVVQFVAHHMTHRLEVATRDMSYA